MERTTNTENVRSFGEIRTEVRTMAITNKFKSTFIETEYDGLFVEILEHFELIEEEPGEYSKINIQDVYTFHTSDFTTRDFWYSTAEREMNGLVKEINNNIWIKVQNSYPFLRERKVIVNP